MATPPPNAPGPQCPCPSCTISAVELNLGSIPSAFPSKSDKKARYAPPQPDTDTFATQQAFLDYLMPVPIESVDEDSKKCPICWKPYGEAADPGFDNSEQPVCLKCRHTFGNKCMLATFAVPGTSTITLEPLAFGPASRGCQLGRHWSSVFQELRRRTEKISRCRKIMLLENATVLDSNRHHTRTLGSFYEGSVIWNNLPIAQPLPSYDLPLLHPSPYTFHTPEGSPYTQDTVLKLKKDSEDRLAKMLKAERDLQERNERHLDNMLGAELSRVYSEYMRHHGTEKEPEQLETYRERYFVDAHISVHKKNPKQSSFRIESLDRFLAHSPDDATGDDSDAEDEESDHLSGAILSRLFPIISRKMCEHCCTEHTTVPPSVPVPTSLWWKDSREIPDDCPICHKILFHKDFLQLFPNSDCEVSGPGDYVGKIGNQKVI
ncbi:hypothetical protein AA0112_g12403 [Alternaria arborescens]|nr:hypothetical protein AA0112_g12403 [Alternaria arborescens]